MEINGYRWMLGEKRSEVIGQKLGQGRGIAQKPYLHLEAAGVITKRTAHVRHLMQNRPGMARKRPACLCRLNAASAALKQRHSQFSLHPAYPGAGRRQRHVGPFGATGYTAGFKHVQKKSQISKIKTHGVTSIAPTAFVFSLSTLKIFHIDHIDKLKDTQVMENNILIFSVGLMAGAMNSVAGGGSFITFPALVFLGVPSVSANATSTVALFPGSLAGAWAYRGESRTFTGAPLKAMIGASLTGGLTGALLLYTTPTNIFDRLIPWLLVMGTLAFAFGPKAGLLVRRKVDVGPGALLVGQAVLAVYGGYFGGAVGIMMMAVWSVFGITDIRSMNAVKTLLVGMTNSAAVLCFAATGLVWWEQSGIMLVGAVIGGYSGARCARRIDPHRLRTGITLFNVVMSAVFIIRSLT